MNNVLRNTIGAILLSAASIVSAATDPATQLPGQAMTERLFPGAKLKRATGLIEVDTKVFVSQDGKVLLVGGRALDPNLLLGNTMAALPAPTAVQAPHPSAAPQQPPAPQKTDFAKLPLEKAIKIVKGDGSRVVAVFTDVDCPFCRRLEQTFGELDNVTIYNFLMPIPVLHPDAMRKSERIWCADDRSTAWKDFWTSNKVPDTTACQTPIADIAKLAADLGINGTPTLIRASDGMIMPGATPKEYLDPWLTPVAKNANTK